MVRGTFQAKNFPTAWWRRAGLAAASALVITATPGVGLAQAQRLTPPPAPAPGPEDGARFGKPFIDVDEMRQTPRPHRYIHGGFEDSHLRFSVYLPPKELYKQRFLLELEGGQGGMDKMMAGADASGVGALAGWGWAFDLAFDDMGAYLVETNEGHWPDEGLGVDNPLHLWQASVYATRYARLIAEQVYGAAPKWGYVNGCSGGGLRSAVHLENAPDLFQGAVPQAWGVNQRPNWSVYGLVGTLLGDKMAGVIDAAEVGGGGDVYKGLDAQQRAALKLMYDMGWPRQAANQMQAGWPASPFSLYNVMDADPEYFKDFWTKPGYLGHDNPKELAALLVETTVTVEKPVTLRELRAQGLARNNPDTATYGAEAGDVLDSQPSAFLKYDGDIRRLFMAKAVIQSGPDAGKPLYLSGVRNGRMVTPFIARASYGFNNVKAGDQLKVDNRDWIAYMYYHRYGLQALTEKLGLQTPRHALMFPEHRALEKPDGKPAYVQRTIPTGWYPGLNGRFQGKMIMLSGTADEPIWPTQMTPYESMVRKNLGDKADQSYRFWWLDHTPHCSGPLTGPRSTRTVPNTGIVAQALRDVMRWAEEGIAPAQDVQYRYAADNALVLAPTAAARRGLQPVVTLKVDGGERVEVRAGMPVTFVGAAEVPPGGGRIVRAQFDFDGQGTWPQDANEAVGPASMSVKTTHSYAKPGTYFAAFRVGSMVEGAKGEPIYNLARVRVVVR